MASQATKAPALIVSPIGEPDRPNGRAEQGFVDHFAIIADDGHGGVVTKTVALIV